MADAAKGLGAALTNPRMATQELEKVFIQLDTATQQQINTLLRSGQFWKAQQLVYEAVGKATKDLSDNSDTLAAAWNRLVNTFQSSKLGQFIAEEVVKFLKEAESAVTSFSNAIDKLGTLWEKVKKVFSTGQPLAPGELAAALNSGQGRLPFGGAAPGAGQSVFPEEPTGARNLSPAEFDKVAESLRKQADAAKIAAQANGLAAGAAAGLQAKQALLNEVTQDGATLTAEQRAEVDKLSGAIAGSAASIAKSNIAWQLRLETLSATGKLTEEQVQIVQRLEPIYGRNIPAALGSAEAAQIRFNNRLKDAADLAGNFINTLVEGLVRGEGLTQSLSKAMQGLGASITQAASKQIGTSIVGSIGTSAIGTSIGSSLSGIFGEAAGGLGSPLAGLAVGAGISLLGSLFDNKGKEAEQQAQQQKLQQVAQAFQQAVDALSSVSASFSKLTEQAKGPLSSAIIEAGNQFQDLTAAANAQKAAASNLGSTYGAGTAQAASAVKSFDDANRAIDDARRRLDEFTQRTLDAGEAALRGTPALSEIAQKIKDLNDQAHDLSDAMQDAGRSAADAANAVANDLAVALQNLADQVSGDLTRAINEATGRGFINQITDLIQKIADLGALNIDPGLVAQFFSVSAQKIIDDAQLTGQAFQDLIEVFPQLTGVVHAFTNATRSAADLADAVQALGDRLFAATNDTSTLAGTLAAFDRSATQQVQAEIAAGGENLVLLETTIAAERLRVIEDFNKQAVEAEQQAAQQRLDALNQAAKSIAQFINDLLVGPASPLSPSKRLAQAQASYNTELALAQAGNIDAQQQITKYAQDLIEAAKSFFGSSAGFQNTVDAVIGQLAALPAVQQTTDPVTQALLNAVVPAIQGTTSAVAATTDTVAAGTDQLTTDNAIQAGILGIINASTAATQNQTLVANDLLNSANSLALSNVTLQGVANSFLDGMNTLLATMADLLAQIRDLNNTSGQQLGHLSNIENHLMFINSHTGHMYAPGGSIQFLLAQGGFVGDFGGSSILRRATGGSVGTDTVPALLTPGEFVVNRAAAQANASLLMRMNAGGSVGYGDSTLARIETILYRIAALQENGNMAVERNTMATVGQTDLLNRETRIQSRKAS